MKKDSSEEFDNMPIDFSFSDNQPKLEKSIHELIQYLNFGSNKQNYADHDYSKMQEELSRLIAYSLS